MQRYFIFTLFSFYFLFSSPGDLFNGAEDPVMVHNVNVITGGLQLGIVDHVVEGAVPLSLQRSYTNYQLQQESISKWQFAKGWSFFSHAHLYLNSYFLGKNEAYIIESSGGVMIYKEVKRTSDVIVLKPDVDKDQNSEVMGYRSDSSNNFLHIIGKHKEMVVLRLADGGTRVYRLHKEPMGWFKNFFKHFDSEYLLSEETSSSGQRTIYRYSNDKKTVTLQSIGKSKKKVFSELVIQRKKTAPNKTIVASTNDGKRFNYFFKGKTNKLTSVSSNVRAKEDIIYKKPNPDEKDWLETISIPGKEGLTVEYYFPERINEFLFFFDIDFKYLQLHKVKTIWEGGQKVASFSYGEGLTMVYDVNQLLTKYYYEHGAFSKIQRFDKNQTLYSEERYLWEGGKLVGKEYLDGQGNLLFSKHFKYDEFKNVIERRVTGKLGESYTKSYVYNKRHLLVEEKEENGLSCYFEYLNDTDLITSKTSMDGEKLLLKESFIYDEDLLLIEKRVFDGTFETYEKWKRDPATGLVVETSNGLTKIFYEYNQNKNLIKQGDKFNQVSFSYDKKGRIKEELLSSGEKNECTYDIYGNAIEIKQIGSLKKQVEYNKQNLPVSCTMNGKKSSNTYDIKGRILTEKNSSHAETSFTYDEFGRMIKKTLPKVLDENGEEYFPEFLFEYDVEGNVVTQTNPTGAVTRSEYNIFKKPIQTIFPDGSTIFNSYYSNGELKESIDKDGAKTTYEYDLLNRLIVKKSELFEEKWEYEGRVLKSYTDPSGLVTVYEYDEFLRKISENCEGRKKEFFYDVMGYLSMTKCGELFNTEEHDSKGRVIQTTQNGFNKISYEYDQEGRKKKATKHTEEGDASDLFFWDGEGVLIKHIDPFGEPTEFIYEGNRRIEIDPLGNRSIEVFDALKRVVRKEKRSKDGELAFAENFFYDRGGNLKKRFTEGHDIEVEYFYDCMGRVILEIESGIKKTSFSYDIKGRVATKTTPNGVVLQYQYDSADRMIELKASDNSVWYEYEYTGVDLTKITDLISGKTLEHSYTKFHEVCEETGFSGFKTSWYFDLYGRKKEVHLPDGSSIFYSYKGSCMSKVLRFDKNKKLLYEHEYTKFDSNHHVKEEKLPFYFGLVKTCRDRMERPTSLESPFHSVGLLFGPSNLVTKKINSLFGDKDYAYDSLNQLTKEGAADYDFDSLGNPKEYEINKLNQIVSADEEQFSYDKNGNLTKRNNTLYSYDALNRLTAIEYPKGKKVTFTYDPLSRLVCKNDDFYLYDGEFEIGKINKQGRILELKVLGLGVKGDTGASIMLEFFGRPYIPLHDLQGNIIAIIDRFDGIAEKYEYNSFGENKRSNYTNPWRFCSKRVEEGLIFFGKRFYDPKLKRWLSPDPLGFTDSCNLYQFNLNNPLNRLDQFGLRSEFYFRTSNDPNVDTSNFPNRMNACPFSSDDYTLPKTMFGTATINGQEMELSIICKRDYTFNFTDEEKAQGYFNMMDYLPDLLQGADNQIGFISYMNGMNCNTDLFISNGVTIADKSPKGSLITGVYNKTEGFWWDCFRVVKELMGYPSKSAFKLAAFLKEKQEIMTKHCPTAKSLHICHSEGGIVFNHAFALLAQETQKWVYNNVYVLALGPLQCIPTSNGLDAVNFYAKQDWITGWFAKKPSKDYNVVCVDLIGGLKNRHKESLLGHDFQGYTYSAILTEEIRNSKRKRGGFYVGNQR